MSFKNSKIKNNDRHMQYAVQRDEEKKLQKNQRKENVNRKKIL